MKKPSATVKKSKTGANRGTLLSTSYKNAGVDIAAGDALVDWLQRPLNQKVPHAEKVVSGIGGFAALFRAQFSNMKSPCLVSSTDGVGTKVKLAAKYRKYEGVGQDLVAMCVNDLACVGAEPLFFLDYYAAGKLDLDAAKKFLTGVRNACHQSGCVLIGGETAEMPGVYSEEDFDCAGFVVGVVDEHEALGAHKVKVGDQLIAMASSGFHSNGYSLLRKLFADDLDKWAEKLLVPTHLYATPTLNLKKVLGADLHAAAHITGGGLDNILRVIPEGTALDMKPWAMPEPFMEVKRRSGTSWPDLLKALNCGLGMVLIVDSKRAQETMQNIEQQGFRAFNVGSVVKGAEKKWSLDTSTWGPRQ